MVAIKNLFLFAIPALSAVIVERQQSVILNDLKLIDADCKALTTAVNQFDGTASKAVAVQNAYNKLDNDIRSSTPRANSSPVLSCPDTQTDINYINNPLEPDCKAAVNALIAKKAQFTSAGYKGIVCDDLKKLRTDTDAYGTALVNKACSSLKSQANSAKAKVIGDIDSGISQFC